MLTIEQLVGKNVELAWMTEQKHKRVVPHRLKDCGYSVFRKPEDQERAVAVRRPPGAALRQGQLARRRTAESRSEF